MKAILEDIKSEKGSTGLYAYRFAVPYFKFKWHYHPEYELTYIVKGSGYRLVGSRYEKYTAGDFVLLGSHLPHTWSGNAHPRATSEAIVIQFSPEFIQPLLACVEFNAVSRLLENASRGLRFKATDELVAMVSAMPTSKGVHRISTLLLLLDALTKTRAQAIAPNSFHTIRSKKNERRINKVCSFLQTNFCHAISLHEVADLISMTESNFCKFFKKTTGKTFSDYVNELRIEEACRWLTQSEKTINQISYDCGFETLSYFNRVFYKKKKQTPSAFRRKNR